MSGVWTIAHIILLECKVDSSHIVLAVRMFLDLAQHMSLSEIAPYARSRKL